MAVSSPTQPSPTHTPHARAARADGASTGRTLPAVPLYLALSVAAVVLALGAATLVLGLLGRGEMYHGVTVGGVDVSGSTRSEAARDIAAWHAAWASQPVTLQVADSDTEVRATPAELGVVLDTDAMLDRAWAYGRSGSLWDRSRDWVSGVVSGEHVEAVYQVDVEQFQQAMQTLSPEVIRAPRSAELVRMDDGTLGIAPAEEGVALDSSTTVAALQRWLQSDLRGPIALATLSVAPATADPALAAILDDARAFADDDLRLAANGTVWAIPADALFSMVRVDVSASPAVLTFDEQALRGWIRSLSASLRSAPINANVTLDGGSVRVTPAVDGHALDLDASVDAAMAALTAGDASADLVLTDEAADLTTVTAEAAAAQAETLVSQGAAVTHNGASYALPTQLLRRALTITVDANATPQVKLAFDRAVIAPALGTLADSVFVLAIDADLRWINNAVEVRAPETAGVELDRDMTLANLEQALADGHTEVAAVTKPLLPAVRADMASTIQIREKLADGRSEYGSSGANRYHNVQLATDRLNGALVPPGGTFSFNRALGPVTFDSGYRSGYGIVATSNGSISTIPSVGGGICQVATTVFQAAFRAGMPIETRSWHLYWIPRYGQAPTGMKGLDATVDPDYNLDFTFKNGSNDWIAVQATYDGSYLNFALWGSPTGWEVIIDQPVITNVKPASQEMFYEDSADMPKGTSTFVEHAEDGFDAAIHRVVKANGQVIDERTFISTYAPARNVTLVGTGS